MSSLCEEEKCCSFSVVPYGVEAREPGCWSEQKLWKMDFQNTRRAGRPRVELSDKRGSVCHPGFRLQSLGEMACVCGGGGGRECCYKLDGMSQIEPLPAQPPCVLTHCCVLGCSSLAAAGRRVPPHKATADLPPPFLPRLRLENHYK